MLRACIYHIQCWYVLHIWYHCACNICARTSTMKPIAHLSSLELGFMNIPSTVRSKHRERRAAALSEQRTWPGHCLCLCLCVVNCCLCVCMFVLLWPLYFVLCCCFCVCVYDVVIMCVFVWPGPCCRSWRSASRGGSESPNRRSYWRLLVVQLLATLIIGTDWYTIADGEKNITDSLSMLLLRWLMYRTSFHRCNRRGPLR